MLALAGCSTNAALQQSRSDEAAKDLAQALEGRTPGKPVDCISTTSISGPQIIDNKTLIYSSGGRVWRQDVVGSCPGLSPFDTIIAELHGSQICRNDRFRAVEPGASIAGPYCRFGAFTPYTKR
ncbi:hypothetical protein AB2M62_13755 [Sphingomonas sp. MMS12-HWE2-04]|uniref:hypothetical protein n=1 Tax=Sphingomonas sp. MMS12-HWE2-04 TaxID=3234199 RepID=UPI00384DBEAD